jgi:hypothetical protein
MIAYYTTESESRIEGTSKNPVGFEKFPRTKGAAYDDFPGADSG